MPHALPSSAALSLHNIHMDSHTWFLYLRAGDLVDRDNQVTARRCESAYHAYRRLPINRNPFHEIFCPSGVIFFNSGDLSTPQGVLNVMDVEILLGHFLHGVYGHIVFSEPSLFSDP